MPPGIINLGPECAAKRERWIVEFGASGNIVDIDLRGPFIFPVRTNGRFHSRRIWACLGHPERFRIFEFIWISPRGARLKRWKPRRLFFCFCPSCGSTDRIYPELCLVSTSVAPSEAQSFDHVGDKMVFCLDRSKIVDHAGDRALGWSMGRLLSVVDS